MGNYNKSEFEDELKVMLAEAKKRGENYLVVVSKVLHDRVLPPPYPKSSGGHPSHRMASACDAMWKVWRDQGKVSERIISDHKPDDKTSTIKIEFKTSI